MGPPQPGNNGMFDAQEGALGPRGMIDKIEYIRVLEQALRALGYESVAAALESSSGIVQQPPAAAAFRSAVLGGRFEEALGLLPSVAADSSVLDRARFLLLKQHYLELVAAGATAAALQVLRVQLQPLQMQQQVLHSLAAKLLRPPAGAATNGVSPPSTPGVAAGAVGGASAGELSAGRAALLDELQDSLLPSMLIPERRLEELVEQALLHQLERSPFHNSRHTHLSLFTDYQAGAEQLPSQPSQVLEAHGSEVWAITFSRDGHWAASASKDGTSILWSVDPSGRFACPRQLVSCAVPCQLVAFSPDSRTVLTACMDSCLRLHDVASAKQLRLFTVTDETSGVGGAAAGGGAAAAAGSAAVPPASAVMAVSWFPDSQRVLVATHRGLAIYSCAAAHPGGGGSPGGAAASGLLRRLPCPHNFIYDALVAPNGDLVVAVGQDKRISFMRLSDQRVEALQECGAVTSIHLSPCGSFLLANLSDSQVHVWALPPGLAGGGGGPGRGGGGGGGGGGAYRSPGGADPLDALPSAPLHELRMGGAKPSRYVLRACVGGARAGFVACGAEDCSIYVWSRRSGELLQSLPGHAGCCNAVAWHPTNPWLMASASDDGTVRTWVAPAALRGS
ncbi:WD repeat-containing 26 [Micractinium conductrix]|uniref:WD repeat-containing 26 n=1 Tax=Micractinium conductrix TaxID=554055 RepID=A0A2P6VDW5_9CHLO|nr:WD repeat-containing 26 [Micractinium conductrix]|eukprot:PSC72285.1 WD repeat-containing 26 [Micractinium conductrix]